MTDNILTAAKPLPRNEEGKLDETFWANGNLYRWLDISEIGITAWTALTNLMDVFYSGQDSAQAVHDYHRKTAVDAGSFTDINELKHFISVRQQNFLDGVVVKTQERYHLSMHIAAILVLREGDDIREYSSDRAEGYISDWDAEGYSHADFFDIAGNLSVAYRRNYRQTQARILEVDMLKKDGSAMSAKGKK